MEMGQMQEGTLERINIEEKLCQEDVASTILLPLYLEGLIPLVHTTITLLKDSCMLIGPLKIISSTFSASRQSQ